MHFHEPNWYIMNMMEKKKEGEKVCINLYMD